MRYNWSKLAIVMEYLERGGKVLLDGRVYVWLNNKVVSETATHQFIIDGLAIEGISYNPQTNEEKPHYMGTKDMSFMYWADLVSNMPDGQYKIICMALRRATDLMNK